MTDLFIYLFIYISSNETDKVLQKFASILILRFKIRKRIKGAKLPLQRQDTDESLRDWKKQKKSKQTSQQKQKIKRAARCF